MNIHEYEVGDTVKIVSSRHSFQWYNAKIGQEYKVSGVGASSWDYLLVNVDGEDIGVLLKDIVLVQKGEKEVPNSQTEDAILHLQSLVDLTGDDVEIIIRENDLFVKAFGKQFYCENADVLEEAAKAAAYLSRQEIV